jgi:hypothetical protein
VIVRGFLLGFVFGLFAWGLLCAPLAFAQVPFTMDDTLAALEGADPFIVCVVRLETDPDWDPYSVGAEGELGAAQLHPRGKLPEFLSGDWTPLPPEFRDPFNPYQAVAYLEWAVARGDAHHWTAARYC